MRKRARCIRGHHHHEDAAWFPALRRANPALHAVIDTLEADHRVVSQLLDAVEQAAARLSSDDGARSALEAALGALAEHLLRHLDYEEASLAPTLRRLQVLAERLPRSVHLRGDVFRRMIINGRAEMTPTLSQEAEQQLWLRYRLAAAAIDLYHQAGFTVVYQDIIIGPALAEVVALYRAYPLSVIVLCPRPEMLAARDAARAKTGYPDASAMHAFDRSLRTETPRIGYWMDTSELTIGETVERILENLTSARVVGLGGAD